MLLQRRYVRLNQILLLIQRILLLALAMRNAGLLVLRFLFFCAACIYILVVSNLVETFNLWGLKLLLGFLAQLEAMIALHSLTGARTDSIGAPRRLLSSEWLLEDCLAGITFTRVLPFRDLRRDEVRLWITMTFESFLRITFNLIGYSIVTTPNCCFVLN